MRQRVNSACLPFFASEIVNKHKHNHLFKLWLDFLTVALNAEKNVWIEKFNRSLTSISQVKSNDGLGELGLASWIFMKPDLMWKW